MKRLQESIARVLEKRKQRVSTAELNRVFNDRFKHHPHPSVGGKDAKFYFLSQVDVSPPKFVLFSSLEASKIHFSYRRFLVNTLREVFDFEGTPIDIHFKKSH